MPERPLLSVIIPTVGRPSLERAVNSLLRQGEWLPWEAILVGDTHAGTWTHQLDRAADLAARYPEHLRYVEHDGGLHAWGHPQRNAGIQHARGEYLSWLGDDDLYLRWAFPTIAQAIGSREEPRVHLFRWIAPWRHVLWEVAGFLAQDHVDAECIVAPNLPDRLGTWTNRYQGDFDFIRQTVENFGGLERVLWQPEVIAQAQPGDAEDWTLGGREHPPVACAVEPRAVFVPVPVEAAA